jgi:hypothetical protein
MRVRSTVEKFPDASIDEMQLTGATTWVVPTCVRIKDQPRRAPKLMATLIAHQWTIRSPIGGDDGFESVCGCPINCQLTIVPTYSLGVDRNEVVRSF